MQRASRGGWTPELAGRALAALRIAGAYATGRAVGQRPAKPGETPRSRACWSSRRSAAATCYVSGAATTESAAIRQRAAGLSDALKTLTVARYGRVEKFDSMADEAVQTAMRVTQRTAVGAFADQGMGGGVLAHRSSICGRKSGRDGL